MNGGVVIAYWLMAGMGFVIGAGLAAVPMLWIYRKLGIIGSR